MKKAYKKYIAEGKLPIYIAIICSVIIRLKFYYGASAQSLQSINGGYLWNLLEPYLHGSILLSSILNFIFAIGIALFVSHLNTRYSIIRKRTNLPFSITLILLSSSAQLITMSPHCIGIFFVLLAIDKLFSCYQQSNSSARIAFDFGFYFALGSLFSQDVLIYIPFFLIGLSFMRSFSFKAIFTSLLGTIFVYWLVLFYFLSKDNLEAFYAPFLHWAEIDIYNYFPFSDYNYIDFGALLFSIIIISIVVFSNYADNYKDKIRVRANISFINMIMIFSMAAYLFIPFKPVVCLMIAITTASVVISHFFALADKRWQVYLFYISLLSLLSYYFFIFSI